MPPLTPANHEIRSRNVAASEVGALLGEHPYTTAGQVWDRLCGGIDREKVTTEAMTFGSMVEPVLQHLAGHALTGLDIMNPVPRIQLNSRTYEHRRVRLCATPDALILGTRELVEFKLSFSQNRWRDGLPPDIEWQARAQMACTRRSRVYVYVFMGIGKLYVVERERNREHRMTQAVERFWTDHVLSGIRPIDEPIRAINPIYRKASRS